MNLEPYALYPLIAAVFLKTGLATLKSRVGKKNCQHFSAGRCLARSYRSSFDSRRLHRCSAHSHQTRALRYCRPRRRLVSSASLSFLCPSGLCSAPSRQLVDTMPEAGKMGQIREVALAVPGARGIEKCFARRTGLKYHVDLHLEVDPDMTVRESHRIAAEVRSAIKSTPSVGSGRTRSRRAVRYGGRTKHLTRFLQRFDGK